MNFIVQLWTCVDRSPPPPPRWVGSPQGPRYRSRGSRAAPSWPTRWGCPHTPGQRGSVQPSALLSEHSEHKTQMLWVYYRRGQIKWDIYLWCINPLNKALGFKVGSVLKNSGIFLSDVHWDFPIRTRESWEKQDWKIFVANTKSWDKIVRLCFRGP